MVYVMSDIHGYYESFLEMLEKIKFSKEDTLYIIGDLIDRGPFSIKLLEHCREKENIIILKGNHENMLEMHKCDNNMERCWLKSGGEETIEDMERLYGKNKEYEDGLMKWIGTLPLFMEVKVEGNKYFLTHAGISEELYKKYYKTYKIKMWQKINMVSLFEWATEYLDWNENNILWDRGIFENGSIRTDSTIIMGHTPTKSKKIERKKNILNIDCGSYKSGGRLGCLCLNNLKEYYVDVEK